MSYLFDHLEPSSVAKSPDGEMLAIGGWLWNNDINLDDTVTLSPCNSGDFGHSVTVLRLKDGFVLRQFFAPERHEIRSDMRAEKECNSYQYFTNVRAVAIASNGRTLASGSADGTVIVWDVATRKTAYMFHGSQAAQAVQCMAFCPGRERLAVGMADGTITIWDVPRGEGKRYSAVGSLNAGRENTTLDICYSPNGSMLAACGSSLSQWGVRAWDAESLEEVRILDTPMHVPMEKIQFSPESKQIVSFTGRLFYVWDIQNKTSTVVLPDRPMEIGRSSFECSEDIMDATFSPDGQYIAVALVNRLVVIHHALEEPWVEKLADGEEVTFTAVAYSRNGCYLAAGTTTGKVLVWDVKTRERKHVAKKLSGSIEAVMFTPDNGHIVGLTRSGLDHALEHSIITGNRDS
jgi:WD40 repeat protein